MDQIFSVHVNGSLPPLGRSTTGFPPSGFRLGTVEKIIESGRFVVALDNGIRVRAEGSGTLKVGDSVRVFPARDSNPVVNRPEELPGLPLESGTLWSAFLPLGFGGEGASVKLQAYVEVDNRGGLAKKSRAVYFVIWTRTEKLGDLQWSIYLKGKQISLQVFAEGGEGAREVLANLAQGVEKALKRLGFVLAAPTVYLARPFRVPEGFRLNVRG